MGDRASRRQLRMARRAISELATVRGEAILAVGIAAAVAVFVDETAAVVIGLPAVATATLAALTLSAQLRTNRRPESGREPDRKVADESRDGRLELARAKLGETASRLGLGRDSERAEAAQPDSFQPLVSIIVPCFNDAAYVEEALKSVSRQSYPSWECIVVDDASTDTSWEVIEGFTEGDQRFKAIRLEANVGSGAARNRGLSAAAGRYVAFLDADDLLLTESIADRVGVLSAHLNDPFVVGSFCAVRSSPEDVSFDTLPDRRHATQPDFVDFVTARGECPFTLHAPLLSADRLRGLGGFDESMTTGAVDWDLWYRLLRNGYVLIPSRTLGAVYRQKQGGITRSNKAGHTEASASLIRAAFSPVDPELLIDPSPFPMAESLGSYESVLVVANRAVRFAAMALGEGDPGEMRQTLSVLDQGTWPLLDRHLGWTAVVGRGLVRVVGLRPKDIPDIEDLLTPYISTVRSAVEEAST